MQQFFHVFLYVVIAIVSLFLICLILIQRGKGGGLAGAFGGAGGSSAFGTKAGDVFTKVTMYTALVWIALNMVLVIVSNKPMSAYGPSPSASKSDKSEVVPPVPTAAGSGAKGETIDLPPKGSAPVTEAPKTGEPTIPVSGGGPAAPLPPIDAGKTAPK